jgi:seryl-tRNA synthetase
MAKLYEINHQIEDLISANIDPDTGMINPEIQEELEELEMQREQKILNIAKYVKNLESDALQHKEESKRQSEKARKLQNKADYLCGYIRTNMDRNEQYEDAQASVGYSKKPSVEIDKFVEVDPSKHLTDNFIRWKHIQTIDKKALLDFIKDNPIPIPGIRIKYNLIIK